MVVRTLTTEATGKYSYYHFGGGLVAKSCLSFVTPWTVAHKAPWSMRILQARILEWVVMASSRGSSQLRDQTQVSHIAGGFFTI